MRCRRCDESEYESDTGQCADGETQLPIRYDSGQIVYSKTFLASGGFGLPWGHSLSYGNLPVGTTTIGVNGRGWYVAELPYLDFTSAGLAVVTSATNNDWFISEQNGWKNKFDGNATLTTDSQGNYLLSREDGTQWTFYASGSLAGKLKTVTDPDGWVTTLEWDALTARLVRIEWEWQGQVRVFSYTHVSSGPNFGLLSEVTLSINGEAVRKVSFTYYDGLGTGGASGNLATAAIFQWTNETGQWEEVSVTGYRYYLFGQANGFEHGLKAIVGPASMQLMQARGVNFLTASDETVLEYSDQWFEYDGFRRVKNERVRGGQAVSSLTYFQNPAAPPYNDVSVWDTYTVEVQPDGNKNRVYSNRAGQPLARIFEETATGRKWVTAWVYDSMFRVVQQAEPSAVEAVIEPVNGSGNLEVILKPNAGLIREWTYYVADDPVTGAARGFQESEGVRQGTQGTPDVVAKRTYDTQTANGYSIHPVRERLVFPIAGVPDVDAPRTAYAREYYENEQNEPTFQVRQLTTIPPVIPTDQHGTGQAEPSEQIFDDEDRLEWERNARGFITFYAYDSATGARILMIQDVDTAKMSGVPDGWVTPPGGGRHLMTHYVSDDQGRILRTLQPWIEVDPATVGVAGAEEPLRVRPVEYTLYRDAAHQVWRAQGWLTGDGTSVSWHIIGPVSLSLMDASGRVTDEIQAPPACACGALGPDTFGKGGQLPPQRQWTRWTHHELDLWGRVVETRVYYAIPDAGEGFEGVNYNATRFSYDVMDRQIRTVSPGGTITRTVYDSRGLRTGTWIGTDDSGATDNDPSGGGTPGNNMKPVWLGEYDNGAAGGDGDLTQAVQPVDDNAANDRVASYAYDYRNRLVQTTASDGIRDYFVVKSYDNLDREIEQARYHTSVTTSNRTHDATTTFDDRSRVIEQRQFYVNANGTLGDALVAGTWYDPNSNIIKQTRQGATVTTKTEFDSLDRPERQYEVAEDPSTAGVDTNSVALDVVITQSETLYNDVSQVLASTSRARFDDATGTGPLQGPHGAQPQSRDSFTAYYADPIGRARFTAVFGTNGGAPWVYPPLHPVPSDVVLVSEQLYATDGGAATWIDPQGTATVEERDRAGRRVRLIENAGGVEEERRVSAFQYAPDGGLHRLILQNPTTGEQVTTWSYGTSLGANDIARSDLPVRKTYPTGESETQTYNRQSQVKTMTDANGTIHGYKLDKLGRLTDDQILTLAAGVDGAVRRISTTYDERGRVQYVTSGSDPEPGQGTVVNQVRMNYNGIDCLTADVQSHSGPVDASTPQVQYTCTAAQNKVLRRTSVVYPNGRTVSYEYGAAGGIDDVLNRVQSVHDDDLTVLAEFQYVGRSMPSVTKLP